MPDPARSHPASHELDAPPWRRVSRLLATARQISKAYNDGFADLGLNLTTATILVYVEEFGPATQTQIADHLGHGRAATSSSIDRLVAEQLVERLPNPADRRVWLISITEKAKPILETIAGIDARIRDGLRHGITRAQRQNSQPSWNSSR
ncbi:MAG: MarR family transcriptional regulator [Acidimicrobiales bacterium]